MGAGKGKSRRARTSSRADKKAAEIQKKLTDTLEQLGYKDFGDFSTEEQVIINNEEDDKGQRPCTELYYYSPEIMQNKGYQVGVILRLDHRTGDMFAVGFVAKTMKYKRPETRVYSIKNCGKNLDRALKAAQILYGLTVRDTNHMRGNSWVTYKNENDLIEVSSTRGYIFQGSDKPITSRLLEGIKEMEERRAGQEKRQEEHEEAKVKADELGYSL